MTGKRSGFSLLELLACVAIAAVLGSLCLAAVQGALNKVQQVKAANQLRQMGVAIKAYTLDNNDYFPQSQHQGNSWIAGLKPYIAKNLYKSPGDDNNLRTFSYAINDYLTPNPYGADGLDLSCSARIRYPSETLIMAEMATDSEGTDHFHFASSGYTPDAFSSEVAVVRYSGSSPYLFVDGHVEVIKWQKLQPLLTRAGSRFIDPRGEP